MRQRRYVTGIKRERAIDTARQCHDDLDGRVAYVMKQANTSNAQQWLEITLLCTLAA
jgi:hypothetical protein